MKKKKLLSLFAFLLIPHQLKASEKSLYDFRWLDEGETIYVVQNKEYMKTRKIGLDLALIRSDSSPYQDTSGYSGAITYYFNENFSIDITHKAYQNANSADVDNLLEATSSSAKPLILKIDSATVLHFNWIPFYGKINTFNKIFFFDWGLGLGIGQFATQSNYKTFELQNVPITFEKATDSGFSLRSYFKFFTRMNVTFGFEYNLTGVSTIKTPDEKKQIHWYTDIIGNIGFIF